MFRRRVFGRTGPESHAVAYGTLLQCYAGFAGLNRHPDVPPRVGFAWLDPMCGLMLAFIVAAALWQRRTQGGVARVDFSMIEAMLWTLAEPLLETQRGVAPATQGDRSDRHRLHGAFRCAGDDEWIALAVGNDAEWRALCGVVPDPVQREAVAEWLRTQSAASAADRLAARRYCSRRACQFPRPCRQRAFARTWVLGCTRGRRSAWLTVAHELRPTGRCRSRARCRHRRGAARRTRSVARRDRRPAQVRRRRVCREERDQAIHHADDGDCFVAHASRNDRAATGCRFRRSECERDGHRPEPNSERADIHPEVAAECVEQPAAGPWADRHAEGRHHRHGAERGAHDPGAEILTHKDRVERHHATEREAKQRRQRVEFRQCPW